MNVGRYHLSSSPLRGQKRTVASSGRSSHASVLKGHDSGRNLCNANVGHYGSLSGIEFNLTFDKNNTNDIIRAFEIGKAKDLVLL
jgi:hypothetical protein